MIIEILTILFTINIVANNSLGLDNNLCKPVCSLSSFLSFIEKKATSDPETKAEHKINTTIRSPIQTLVH